MLKASVIGKLLSSALTIVDYHYLCQEFVFRIGKGDGEERMKRR